MIALRLAIRQWLSRPLRPILCSLAIAAAVALIVGVGAGMDSMMERLKLTQAEIVGKADITVRRAEPGLQFRMPEAVGDLLRKRHPEITVINPRIETFVRIYPPGKGDDDHVDYEITGYRRKTEELLHPKDFVAGGYPEGDGIIIDELVAKTLPAKVGDKITLDGLIKKPHELVVTGILHRVALTSGTKPLLMVPADILVQDAKIPPTMVNVLELQIQGRPQGPALEALAKQIGEGLGNEYKVMAVMARKNSLEKTSQRMDVVITILSIISGLSATIIIGTTLSVGVQERLRQFGQLRCIGASRGQLVTILAADALMLVLLGITLGLLIGYFGSKIVIGSFPNFFPVFVLSHGSLILAVCIGIGATLLGSAIPAFRISRVTPMQAVALTGKPARKGGVALAAYIGLGLLALQASLWIFAPTPEFGFLSYLAAGAPLIFVGYCLLAPAVLLGTQRAATTIFGAVLRVKPALLRQTWTQTPWRAGAMIAALMIGVIMYAGIRLRTEGIASNWDFPKVFPDVIMLSGNGSPREDIMSLKKSVDGITKITAFGLSTVKMQQRVFGAGKVLDTKNTRFAAIDASTFRTMVELEFIQGNPNEAMDKLQKGGYILVSKEFFNKRGLGVGAKLSFETWEKNKTVDLEIAGVCNSTGIEMLRAYYDMTGSFEDEAVGTVIGSAVDGEKYFNIQSVNVALLNLDIGARTSEEIIKLLRDRANAKNSLERTGNNVIDFFNAVAPKKTPQDTSLTNFVTNPADLLTWQAASVIDIKTFIADTIGRAVRALTIIALAAMAIAGLGIANMVIASMHARTFEFGVLRAIGAGRGQLLRMVLAEISVVALVAGLLGSLASLHYAFMGTRVDRLLVGYTTPFITWEMLPKMALHIATAIGVTIFLSWLAALIPAIRTAYRPQRELLAAGRA